MRYISEKVSEGILDLSALPKDLLIDWFQNSKSQIDRDLLATEIMYR